MARPERVMAAKMLMKGCAHKGAEAEPRGDDEGDHEFRGPPKSVGARKPGLPAEPLRRATLKRVARKLQRNSRR